MKSSGLIIRTVLFLLLVLPIWLIPSEAFSADRAFPKFYIEPTFTFLTRNLVEDAYTIHAPGPIPVDSTSPSVDSIRLLLKLGAEITQNIEMYGLIGGSNMHIDDLNFQSGVVPAYGGGIRLKMEPGFYPEERLSLFLDYHYLTYHAEEDGIAFNPINANTGRYVFLNPSPPFNPQPRNASEKITWQEHVLKVGVSGRHELLEPYGGIQFSFVDASHQVTYPPGGAGQPGGGQLNLDIDEDLFFGLFAGIHIYLDPKERQAIFVELHAIDEDSITLGYRMNF